MKKRLNLTAFLLIVAMVLSYPAVYAAENNTVLAQIPSYDCVWWQRGDLPVRTIEYQNSQYPLLNYKDITYFPLTWDYADLMNLACVWVEGEGLFIAYHPDYARAEQPLPSYPAVNNQRWNSAVIPSYPVYLNGKRIPTDAEYPLLNFRDVTYFPLTWEYAHDCFGWDIDFTVSGNNQLGINTFHGGNTFDYMAVCEETEEGAVIFVQHTVPAWSDSEEVRYDYQNVYEKLSFADDSLTTLSDYDASAQNRGITHTDRTDALSIEEDKLMIGGVTLGAIGYLIEGSETKESLHLTGSEWEDKGAVFLSVSVYAKWDEIPAPYTPHEDFLYLRQGGRYTLVARDAAVNRVEVYKDNVYIDTTKRTGFRGTHFLSHILYQVAPDGTVVDLTAKDPKHGSIKLLGKTNSGIVVEALWAPETEASDIVSSYFANLSVSPCNDGFFLYDGMDFSLLHRYTFSTGAIVSPQGNIYLMNGYRQGSIQKLQ